MKTIVMRSSFENYHAPSTCHFCLGKPSETQNWTLTGKDHDTSEDFICDNCVDAFEAFLVRHKGKLSVKETKTKT